MQQRLGPDYDSFIVSLSEPPPVSVRLNRGKPADKFNDYEKVPWANDAFYLPERISFTLDPLFHAGCYYVQEASSMFLSQALNIAFADGSPLRILDLCASPGGKSTHIASRMPAGSLLVANEIIPSRNKILQHNLIKWGNPNVIVTQNSAADFNRLPGFFDLILVDAPCSGEGLFRKDADAVAEWSAASVDHCAFRQSSILDDVAGSLKECGILIYCTCTFEDSENDKQAERLINKQQFQKVDIPGIHSGITATGYGYAFYPHLIKGEGFYLAMLKNLKHNQGSYTKNKSKLSGLFSKHFKNYLTGHDQFSGFEKDNELYAIPQNIADDFQILSKNLYIRQAGIKLGKLMNGEIIPSHQLALSTSILAGLPSIGLNVKDALHYLRNEIPSVGSYTPGWYLAQYDGFNLGWMKVLRNRINNYFPREFRILKR